MGGGRGSEVSTSTLPTDLSDLQNDLIQRVRDETGITTTNTIATRFLNIGLADMHSDPGSVFPWAARRAVLITHAPYTAGTVGVRAAARTTVTGASTLWNTAVTGFGFNNARIGGKMVFSGLSEIYDVSAVGSDTAITISPQWVGSALSAAT